MARYDYKCSECGEVVEVTCSPHALAENWPTCPEGCTPIDLCQSTMGRVWTAPATVWHTHGSTKDKRGLPDVK